MTAVLTPAPRRGSGRAPDHAGLRLPGLKRRFVPPALPRPSASGGGRRPLGGPPLRAA